MNLFTVADIRWFYRDVLITHQLLPVVQEISGDFFILQQDSAPAHRARDKSNFLNGRHPRSLHQTCGPNSPDLNPVDYRILSEIRQRVYRTKVWMNWSGVLSMCGIAWDKTSSMTQLLMSGANVCLRVFVPKEDILSICFDSRARTW